MTNEINVNYSVALRVATMIKLLVEWKLRDAVSYFH